MGRRRATGIAVLSMETLWLFVLGNLLAAPAGGAGPGVLSIALAACGGNGLIHLLERLDLAPRRLLIMGIVCSVIGLYAIAWLEYGTGNNPLDLSPALAKLGDPQRGVSRHWAQIAGIVILGAAWLRASLSISRVHLTYPAVLQSFSIGLGVVVAGLLFGRAAVASGAIDRAALPFFGTGLLALALVHLGQSEHIRGDTWRGPWLAVLAGTAAVIALLGAVAGLLPLSLISRILAPVGGLLLLILDLAIYAVALPLALVVSWILARLLSGRYRPPQPAPNTASEAARRLQEGHPSAFIVALSFLFKVLFLALIAYLIFLILRWTYGRLRRASAVEESVERESVWTDGSLRNDLAALLGSLRRRLRRPGAAPEPDLTPSILALRRLYLALLGRAAASGLPRPAAATPKEFVPPLVERYRSPAPALVSQGFSAGRYGRVEPAPDELAQLERALQELREP